MPSATATAIKPAGASKKALEDVRDDRIEKLLKNNGFTAAQLLLNVNLKEFDKEASLRNQARVGSPVNPAYVKELVTFLENGDRFPPLIAWERTEGTKLRIVDGNHRFLAYEEVGQSTTNVYVIYGGRADEITRLAMIVNRDHGLRLSEKDRIHSALYLMDVMKISAEEAARQTGLNVHKLRNLRKIAEADSRAERAGVNMRHWEKRIKTVSKTRLNSIRVDEIFAAMTKLAVEAHLSHEEINIHVTELARVGSFANQKKYVEMLRETYAERLRQGANSDANAVGRQTMSALRVARMTIGQAVVFPRPEAVLERMTPDDMATMLPRLDEGIGNLEALRTAVRAALKV